MGKIQKKGEKGAATNYVNRNQALKKLQLSLAAFRRLCILKGIYPREPKNKKKAGKGSTAPRTYYYKKDIQYLLHEPLVQKYRDYKTYQNKLKKAVLRKEWSVAKSLEANKKPDFRLDHIIKERYPTFIDALRDLDDALSMIFLFSTLPSLDRIVVSKIRECQRLAAEFQAYVANTKSLRKVFVSIKGIYYQAEIRGQEITWIVPHQFTQNVPQTVDFKIMATFLDLYLSLVGFVNFKLYSDENFVYPPKIDIEKDGRGAGLNAFILESTSAQYEILNRVKDHGDVANQKAETKKQSKSSVKQNQKQAMSKLPEKLKLLADQEEEVEELGDDEEELDQSIGIDAVDDDSDDKVDLSAPNLVAAFQSLNQFKNLFKGCYFWLSREVPRHSLEFVLKSFGAEVGWEDNLDDNKSSSPYNVTDSRITHHIVDRPLPPNGVKPSWVVDDRRDYIQPQWVFDCVNAQKLLKTKSYHPGDVLPAHLSPFVKYESGDYVPEDAKRLFGISAVAVSKGIDEGSMEALNDKDEEENGDKSESENEDSSESDGDEDLENEEGSDEELYEEELKAEAAGLTYSEYMQKKDSEKKEDKKDNKRKRIEVAPKGSTVTKKVKKSKKEEMENEEKKELAKMMMPKKDKRLYQQIQFGKDKKAVEVAKLEKKRDAHKKNNKKGKSPVKK
ncbi:mRNA-binding ribosome synthesis protein nop7 [Lobulomyces angularis]|nr:mRNA-binding ribosome synthesis protein nop7 [Lobulomyces angularis]